MAAAISALNAKIRSNAVSNYVCSTHFWGPVSNFGIPIAAVMDTQKDPEIISGTMTVALTLYAATFMRYALAVTPKNYLLFGCHVVNFGAQTTQGYRWYNYWQDMKTGKRTGRHADTLDKSNGGNERKLAEQAKAGAGVVEDKAQGALAGAKDLVQKAKDQVAR